jgi:hypothetical protein
LFGALIESNLKTMKGICKTSGLSARRGSIETMWKNICDGSCFSNRAKFLAFIAAISIAFSSCDKKVDGQNLEHSKKDHAAVTKDSLDEPKVNIKVNRHYDEKGNLIGFDSTYSKFYSNVKGDTAAMDSLMNNFDRYFNRNHSSLFDRHFNTLFFNDSARYPDFFHDDFFMKRYELNDKYLRRMMQDMDSIKNDFFRDRSTKRKLQRPVD